MVIFSFAALAILHVTFDWNGKCLDEFVKKSKLSPTDKGMCVIRTFPKFKVKSKVNGPEVEKQAYVLTCIFKDLPTDGAENAIKSFPEPAGMEDYDKLTLQHALGVPFVVQIGNATHSVEGQMFPVTIEDLKTAKIVTSASKKPIGESDSDASQSLV